MVLKILNIIFQNYTFADRGEEEREDKNLLILPTDFAKLTKQSDIGKKV